MQPVICRSRDHDITWSPICASDLPSLHNVKIVATVSDECSRLEVLGTEGMITIKVLVVEECKFELAPKKFCAVN